MSEVIFDKLLDKWARELLAVEAPTSQWYAPLTPDMLELAQQAAKNPERWAKWPKGIARPNQRPPSNSLDWLVWIILAGRGFGKSRSGSEWLDDQARRHCTPGEQVLLAGRTPADVRTYALYGPGGLLTNHPDVVYNESKRELHWPNGVLGIVRSGANPEEFRGFSGAKAWLDEFCAWQYPAESWSNLILGMRESDPLICITTTPRPLKVLKEILAMEGALAIKASSYDNKANLAEKYVRLVLDPLVGTRKGRQEILAELLEDIEGALWRLSKIDDHRCSAKPDDLTRVVVGVDPQGTKRDEDKDGSSLNRATVTLTGIVTAGATESDYYVLEDSSLNGRPDEWGTAAVEAYHRHKADAIVAERNYGGDMVEHVIKSIDKSVNVIVVTASRGKIQRAEPIAALYEKGRVHHVGCFKELEDEQCNFVPGSGWSPNRMDAAVWGLTELSSPTGQVQWSADAWYR